MDIAHINSLFYSWTTNCTKHYTHAYKLIFEYIETFYNTVRIHSHCGYLSPNEYEEQYLKNVSDLSCELIFICMNHMISWNQIDSVYYYYHQYYSQFVLPSFPQYGQIITCEETINLSPPDNYLNDMSHSQKLILYLNANLRTGNLSETILVLDDFHEIFKKFGSMHHLTAISLYHKISNIYIEFIIQYQLIEKIALQIGLYKLYSPDHFQSWLDLITYYKKLSAILIKTISFYASSDK